MHIPQALSLDQNNVTLCLTALLAQNSLNWYPSLLPIDETRSGLLTWDLVPKCLTFRAFRGSGLVLCDFGLDWHFQVDKLPLCITCL